MVLTHSYTKYKDGGDRGDAIFPFRVREVATALDMLGALENEVLKNQLKGQVITSAVCRLLLWWMLA